MIWGQISERHLSEEFSANRKPRKTFERNTNQRNRVRMWVWGWGRFCFSLSCTFAEMVFRWKTRSFKCFSLNGHHVEIWTPTDTLETAYHRLDKNLSKDLTQTSISRIRWHISSLPPSPTRWVMRVSTYPANISQTCQTSWMGHHWRW